MYKYAECASACYALFDKDEFIESYNFNKVNPDNIDNMSIVIANTYEDFLTKKDKFGKESEITEKARRVWLDEENCLAKRKSEACKELYNEIGKYIYELWD